MQIKINGEARTFEGGMNLQGLVEHLALNPTQVALECNAQIIPRTRYAAHQLNDGDEVEIVRFIGGG